MNKQQIEDYPELEEWLDNSAYNPAPDFLYDQGNFYIEREVTKEKLLEMQATIDAQQERISELEKFARVANRFAVGLAPILQSEGYHGLVENCQDLNERVLKLLNKESK